MTFPGLTVRDNLRIGEHSFRRQTSRAKVALDDAVGLFPELEPRLDQPAGTLSGGEQQMLALARVMMSKPRLLMIDELAFGLAPMTVERLMDIVRRVNADGATVILVEQSVNRAMTLAEHAFFLERGEVRFDGLDHRSLVARRPPPTRLPRLRSTDALGNGTARSATAPEPAPALESAPGPATAPRGRCHADLGPATAPDAAGRRRPVGRERRTGATVKTRRDTGQEDGRTPGGGPA